MLFSQLKIGDTVHIIEVFGTFKKNTEYSIGTITQVSKPYDEPLPQNQYQIPNPIRKRVVDLNISSNGETKKFTVPEDRSIITDSTLGLTISTDKNDIVNIIQSQYDMYKARKESIAKCDEEMDKCRAILDKLNIREDSQKEDTIIKNMQAQINKLQSIIEQQKQPKQQVNQQPILQPIQQSVPQLQMNQVGQ